MEHEGDNDTSCGWCTWHNPPKLVQGLEDLEIRGQVETIQNTALLKSIRKLTIGETCCHSSSCGKPSANAGVKILKRVIIITTKFARERK